MRRSLLLLCAMVLVLAGCGRPAIDGHGGTPAAPRGPAAPGGAPDPKDAPAVAPLSATQRDTQIFIAVLRRYLASDTSFPDPFPVVFVLDHTELGADDPFRTENSPPGPTIEEQPAIVAALADMARLEFVPSRKDVIKSRNGCAVVRDGGILITLSRPEGKGDRVEVPVNGFVACLGATWLTYVVERSTTEWEVTGTTGTMGIS